MQIPVTSSLKATTARLAAAEKKSDRLLFLIIFVTVLLATPLIALGGATSSFTYIVGGLIALILAALVARWPTIGLYVITGCVVLIEQQPLPIHVLTDQLYVYYWPAGLQGIIDRPIGLLLLFTLLASICHRLLLRQRVLLGGPLCLPFLAFLACIVMGIAHGLASGGTFQIMVLEVRPFWYIFVAYLLAYNFLTQKNHVRALIWMFIVGAGIKGLQGDYIYVQIHGDLTNYHQIMSHEESFFFVAMILLLLLFCIHHRYRPQIYALLLIMPFVLVALYANQRRADYVALLVGVFVACALIFLVRPQQRKRLVAGGLIAVILGTGYILAFDHASGALGEPARSIVSIFYTNPNDTTGDASSNLYRAIENGDLKYTVKQSPLIGWGFGKPFLQPAALPNISQTDPYYLYVPHNTIYWVWMRMGAIGYAVFWYLIGTAIIRGISILRRLRDPYLQVIAIFVIAATVMEVVVAYADYQLYFFRNTLYLGLLLGLLMKLPTLDGAEKTEQSIHEAARGIYPTAPATVGSQRT
jgi:hypothetical protein